MLKQYCLPLLFIALLVVGSSGQGQEKPILAPVMPATVPKAKALTLSQAIAIALEQNPLQRAAMHQISSARANLSGQRMPINPTLSFSGLNNTVAPLNPGDLNNYNIYYTVETSGRQRWRMDQARAQLNGTQADAETTRLTVRQAVSNAYINLQVADLALENERDAFETARRLSNLTEKQFQLGAAPETNAIRSRIALAQEEQNLLKAISDVRIARANLNIQIGRPANDLVDTAEPLEYAPISVPLAALQQQALLARPELRSAEANTRTLQANVGFQRSQYYPDIVLGANGTFNQLQLGLTLPLFDFGSIRGSVRKAKEDVKTQEAQVDQVRQTIDLDIETAYLVLTREQELVASFQDGILHRAESLLKRVEQGYKLGASNILDLIDAQQTFRTTRSDYFGAIGDYRHSLVQLERAVGSSLDARMIRER